MMTILLAEDDPDDQYLFEDALSNTDDRCHVDIVKNGQDVFKYLSDNKKPDVIVLDLNMPIVDGYKALAQLQADERYKGIPVYILTTSDKKEDVAACKKLGCKDFYTKAFTTQGLQKIVQEIVTREGGCSDGGQD